MTSVKRRPVCFSLLLAGALSSLQAGQVGLNLGEAQDFNLLTWGNATLLNSSAQGRVAAGGNASFNGYSLGSGAGISDPATGALIVGGDLTATNGTVSGGSIYTGGTYSGPGYNINATAGSVASSGLGNAGLPFDFASAETALSAKSLLYGSQLATGSSVFQWSTLTLTGTNADLNIFSIDSLTLANASSLVIDVAAGSQVLINVSGGNVTFGNKGIDANAGASDILYNFYEATSLTMTGIGINGSVLASFADVSFYSGNLNGQLIAKSYGGAQWGSGSLGSGSFNNQAAGLPSHSVPDEASTGVLLLGVLGAGLAVRRYRFFR